MSDFCKSCKNKGSGNAECCFCNQAEFNGTPIGTPTNYTPKEENNETKHLKGYIYDSLVFRYQMALARGINARVQEFIALGKTRSDAIDKTIKENNRDLMRFCMILDEAIGEHD